jgi:glyoxylase-like metal-dependent hydrolase (beta-lactamase superfamily II)
LSGAVVREVVACAADPVDPAGAPEEAMKLVWPVLLALALVVDPQAARAELAPGSMDVRWDPGAKDCTAVGRPPIQVHAYNPQTFILRENLCATWEAPFMYVLLGTQRALLVDTGDVADPARVPLAATVMGLLPGEGPSKPPLLVVHTHGHLDHRRGDGQFEHLPNVQLVPSDLDHVRRFFGFSDWPSGHAEVDLGGRIVDVVPAPGHHPAHVVYYDRSTGILFSGDFLLPGRLLVDDLAGYRASARRVADFLKDRPVCWVLGGHIEKNVSGELLPWQSTYHPEEAPLQLTKADVLALPAALAKFNGFYTATGGFVIMNPIHNLIAMAAGLLIVLTAIGYLLFRFIRRRRRRRLA